jgi:hypothetical protein
MGRIRFTVICLLAGTVFLTTGTATAQGRVPSPKESRNRVPTDPAARAAKLAELDSWLGQLRGHFRIAVPPTPAFCSLGAGTVCPIEGSAECNAATDGADVSCLFEWSSVAPFLPRNAVYGIDPEQLELRLHWVESSGATVDAVASPKAARAVFKTGGGGTPVQIDARPGGQVLVITVRSELRSSLSANRIPVTVPLELYRQVPGAPGAR